MSVAATEPAKNQTEPTPTTEPAPAVTTPADGGKPQEPAPSDGKTLLADKPAEGDPKPADTKPTEPAKPEGAPEKYEFKAPEGKEYDTQLIGSFSEAAKDANLTQDAAQKLLDKVAPALQARTEEQVKAVHQQWTEASTADKEFGGDKLKENLGIARKALEQFGSKELRTFLEESGLGSHPEVIRMLYRAGKAISEDGFVSGSPGGKSTVNVESVLYDKTTQQKD